MMSTPVIRGGGGGGGGGRTPATGAPVDDLPPVVARGSSGKGFRPAKALPSFFKNFLEDDLSRISDTIDLHLHAEESGISVTNATIQEISEMFPNTLSLNLNGCAEVTDIGLWNVAYWMTNLTELRMSGLTQISHVGLRSLSLRVKKLRVLDLSRCMLVDANGIRVVAAGFWELRDLNIAGCPQIDDKGMAEVASCCKNLKSITMSRCNNISDTSLKNIGENCTSLTYLDVRGCKLVHNEGVQVVAQGCPDLTTLKAENCADLGRRAIMALCRHSKFLTHLNLGGCINLTDDDLSRIGRSLPALTYLNIRKCTAISNDGMRGFAAHADQLLELNLENVKGLGTPALRAMSRGLSSLRTLNLTGCKRIKEPGVRDLVVGCSRLTTLNLNKCKDVSRAFIVAVAAELPFVQNAVDYFGLMPQADAEARIALTDIRRRQAITAIRIQRIWWGYKDRKFVRALRAEIAYRRVVITCQRVIRGHLSRVRVRRIRQWLAREEAALMIQSMFRGFVGRKRAEARWRVVELERTKEAAARTIQRIAHGWFARRVIQLIRRANYAEMVAEQRMKHRRVQMACRIQRQWAVHLARKRAWWLKAHKEALRLQRLREQEAARFIQRMYRGHTARQLAARLRADLAQFIRETRAAMRIQCMVRARFARLVARILRRQAYERRILASVRIIQRVWRGSRGRHLYAVMLALAHLRAVEDDAALVIQTKYRSFKSRKFFKTLMKAKADKEGMDRTATQIQRAFRGMKGRQIAEIKRNMAEVRAMSAPLQDAIRAIEAEAMEAQKEYDMKKALLKHTEERMATWSEEYEVVKSVGFKFYDSDKITGTKQRFETKFLRKALKTQLGALSKEVLQRQTDFEDVTFKLHDAERRLRAKRRDLVPLEANLVAATLAARKQRVFERWVRESKAAMLVQGVVRGRAVRKALAAGANLWTELYDEERGQAYYFHTVSEVKRWTRPVDFDLYESAPKPDSHGWTTVFDENAGKHFYHNTKTGEYRWEMPVEMQTHVKDGKPQGDEWLQKHGGKVTARSLKSKQIGDKWWEMRDPVSGNVYYQHDTTGETRWSLSPRAAAAAEVVPYEGPKPVTPPSTKAPYGKDWWLAQDKGDLTDRSRRLAEFGDWQKLKDPVSGAEYFHNKLTNETSWEKPEELEYDYAWFRSQNLKALTDRSERLRDFGDWVEYHDEESGTNYFYNNETGESSWEMPAELRGGRKDKTWWNDQDHSVLADDSETIKEFPGTHWRKVRHGESQVTFFYNHDTGVGSWTMPAELTDGGAPKALTDTAARGGIAMPALTGGTSAADLLAALEDDAADDPTNPDARMAKKHREERAAHVRALEDRDAATKGAVASQVDGARLDDLTTGPGWRVKEPTKEIEHIAGGKGESKGTEEGEGKGTEGGDGESKYADLPKLSGNFERDWLVLDDPTFLPPMLRKKLESVAKESRPYPDRRSHIRYLQMRLAEKEWLLATGVANQIITRQRSQAEADAVAKAKADAEAARIFHEEDLVRQRHARAAMYLEDKASMTAEKAERSRVLAERRAYREFERRQTELARGGMLIADRESKSYERAVTHAAEEAEQARLYAANEGVRRAEERREEAERMTMFYTDGESRDVNIMWDRIARETAAKELAELEMEALIARARELDEQEAKRDLELAAAAAASAAGVDPSIALGSSSRALVPAAASKQTALVVADTVEGSDMWETSEDADGRKFYFNVNTRETTYEKPVELGGTYKAEAKSALPALEDGDASSIDDFESVEGDDGAKFFYSPSRNKSVWDRPKRRGKAEEPALVPGTVFTDANGDEWEVHEADDGRIFKFNVQTEESVWVT